KRGLNADAVDRDGAFLDVGCASGYLLETLVAWCRERGIAIDPYGLDISPELADIARRRLPQWAERVFVGNALTWIPPRRFSAASMPRHARSSSRARRTTSRRAPLGWRHRFARTLRAL
ncbi:MAG: class I SAM-dependent methyltransferase, partial [Gemmatimonadales bacterium]